MSPSCLHTPQILQQRQRSDGTLASRLHVEARVGMLTCLSLGLQTLLPSAQPHTAVCGCTARLDAAGLLLPGAFLMPLLFCSGKKIKVQVYNARARGVFLFPLNLVLIGIRVDPDGYDCTMKISTNVA